MKMNRALETSEIIPKCLTFVSLNSQGRRNAGWKQIMTKNFLNLAKDINPQIQEAQWSSNRMNPKTPCLDTSQSNCWKPWKRKLETSQKDDILLRTIQMIVGFLNQKSGIHKCKKRCTFSPMKLAKIWKVNTIWCKKQRGIIYQKFKSGYLLTFSSTSRNISY